MHEELFEHAEQCCSLKSAMRRGVLVALMAVLLLAAGSAIAGPKPTKGYCSLLEIDRSSVRKRVLVETQVRVRWVLREQRIGYMGLRVADGGVTVNIRNPSDLPRARQAIREAIYPVPGGRGDDHAVRFEGRQIHLMPSQALVDDETEAGIVRGVAFIGEMLRWRGAGAMAATRRSKHQIHVFVSGARRLNEYFKSPAPSFARTEVRWLHPTITPSADDDQGGVVGFRVVHGIGDPAPRYLVSERPLVSGQDFRSASVMRDANGSEAIRLQLRFLGARRFRLFTMKNRGKTLAFINDNKVLATKVIDAPITDGIFDIQPGKMPIDAEKLVRAIRLSFFPAPLKLLKEEACSR